MVEADAENLESLCTSNIVVPREYYRCTHTVKEIKQKIAHYSIKNYILQSQSDASILQ